MRVTGEKVASRSRNKVQGNDAGGAIAAKGRLSPWTSNTFSQPFAQHGRTSEAGPGARGKS